MAKNGGKGFLLKTNLYKSPNDADLLGTENQEREGKESINPEGVAVNKQEQIPIKQQATRKTHNNIYANIEHPV